MTMWFSAHTRVRSRLKTSPVSRVRVRVTNVYVTAIKPDLK